MSPCPDRELLLQALLDGELDAANAAGLETHMRTCPGCAAHFLTLRAVRTRLAEADLDAPAPRRLRGRIETMIEAETRGATKQKPWWAGATAGWSAAGVMTAIAASLLLVQVAPLETASLQDQFVASHVRSLEVSHLIDVATSDRHVVKPWFNGKIDFAPPVVDLANQGFPLVGGRLDYADQRPVAALVFKRHAHVINLFILPSTRTPLSWRARPAPTSYSVVHWSRGGLDFWAVSDVDAGQLEAFEKAYAAQTPG